MKFILSPEFFPALLIVLFVLAGIRYAFAGDWARSVYWFAGSVLNVAVLSMGKT